MEKKKQTNREVDPGSTKLLHHCWKQSFLTFVICKTKTKHQNCFLSYRLFWFLKLTTLLTSKKYIYIYIWNITAFQCCVSFFSTTKCIRYMYTHILSLLDLPPPAHPTHLDHHRAQN